MYSAYDKITPKGPAGSIFANIFANTSTLPNITQTKARSGQFTRKPRTLFHLSPSSAPFPRCGWPRAGMFLYKCSSGLVRCKRALWRVLVGDAPASAPQPQPAAQPPSRKRRGVDGGTTTAQKRPSVVRPRGGISAVRTPEDGDEDIHWCSCFARFCTMYLQLRF